MLQLYELSTFYPSQLHSRFTAPSSPSTVSGSRHTSMALAAAAFAKLNSKEMCKHFVVFEKCMNKLFAASGIF